jgi:hypothetical protein
MFRWLAARIRTENICEKYPNRDFESELKAKLVKRMSMKKRIYDQIRYGAFFLDNVVPFSARSAAFSPSIDGSHRPF